LLIKKEERIVMATGMGLRAAFSEQLLIDVPKRWRPVRWISNVKVRDLLKRLEHDGWRLDRIRGSHRHYRHPGKPFLGTLTVAGHESSDIPKGTLNAILKQAGFKQ
jgi:predicted RNA binding protein YcfA (HicA-like mRNA interferase family)